jgi:hypothetical protein
VLERKANPSALEPSPLVRGVPDALESVMITPWMDWGIV